MKEKRRGRESFLSSSGAIKLLSWPEFNGHLKRGHDTLPRKCDMGQRRRFTPEFKRQAVQLLNAGQRPVAEIACDLGIPL